ncbi:MAG: glycerol-3-phosphate acyltransferase [Anaerolineae bacterium]|nr:glycerol-3-phosphate acyltransferase [Anaerolineae bacterium]
MDWLILSFVAVGSYLVGAIPTAYLVCRSRGINVFEIGSGNMGTTNVNRALGPRYAAVTMIVDFAKGIIPALVARQFVAGAPAVGGVVAALAAIIGHTWSVWILLLTGELRGGKAAATTAGTWLVISPWYISALCAVTFAVVLLGTRIMSLSVLVVIGVGIVGLLVLTALQAVDPVLGVYGIVVFVLIFYNHRSNIARLRMGKERPVEEEC